MTVRRWVFLALTLVVCGGLYFGYGRFYGKPEQAANAKGRPNAVPVTVMTARATTFPVVLSGLGTVQAFNTVTARTRVDGEVIKILFKEGQTVQQGDQLARIDPRPYQAAVDQATAKLAQDQATLHNSELDLQRYSTLAKQDFASRQQLDTQTAAVAQNTALVQADNAALDNAKTQLDYTNIRSPITGRVGFRLVDQGNIVNASSQTGIVTITQVQPISAVFTLPEGQISDINAAMQKGAVVATAYSADGKRKLADGTLTVINNQVDASTATIQLKATFPNADNALWPGLAVVVRLPIQTLDNVVVVPQSAVQHAQQGLTAYVVDGNQKAQIRPVEIGEGNTDDVVITKGIAPGDRVVVAGQYRLQNGSTVAVNEASNETVGRSARP
ncbi:efflux RND transporter periplasmic adaptor subunit [Bradyrhizobium sp. U87765 SZCCT0131]|uniref:efflux RND transporter periplasmic adaptor subunit n=1 Tax=unclassified Bradyrhizobium TaxID=2631580 RepID=UPI001BA62070|nr:MULTISPECIES: efflux RND transporter periplasmic adaptor subunit [unclassified Bradyrhizobium]MBR1222699.1 efflux RND transporter periplasmic adaptor subunit [Bradyrhizobium sp. U87765 SZCCT0131]MBR1265220.1 efflux RND transporter periplasmic adaptor subunit [Bradyrhizobium sp. U87765 SZCCT0134]MBR1303001.1 efflux RND transporter periplasmic adaptor subunit [Bradyrhizobium sp. U87765 SZCCT0110]MBR1323699.1 efflux RND transporter periplasmic adaptor subunit [Bradyrhizobium sp. U87765 SZCCT010